MTPSTNRIVQVIVGPTGVGKTAYALEMAQRWGCPIINADSRQIYRELPIGTAAPTEEERALVPHFFVGTKSIVEDYNAGQYARDALEVISQYPKVILTGGSMMYIDAVCNGLDDIPNVEPAYRKKVQQLYRHEGLTGLQTEVQRLDPAYWEIVDHANPQRLMHCLEICYQTGESYSQLRKGRRAARDFKVQKIGLIREREVLYQRINERVLKMMDNGLLEEAKRAFEIVGELIPNSLNTVGYKELHAYLQGRCSLDDAIKMIQQNSRHYAKRQITWWRRDNEIQWVAL